MERKNNRESNEILSQCRLKYEELLNEALCKQLDRLFANPNGETWAEIRKLLVSETQTAVGKLLLADISDLELDDKERVKLAQDLAQYLSDYGRNVVKLKAKEGADKVLQRMKVRYSFILNDTLVRGKTDKRTAKEACIESLKLLSVMVAIRLDEKPVQIDNKVFSFVKKKMDHHESTHSSKHNKIFEFSKDAMGKVEEKLISSQKQKQNKVIENMLISSLMGEKSKSKDTLTGTTWPEAATGQVYASLAGAGATLAGAGVSLMGGGGNNTAGGGSNFTFNC
ncbi:hypothetical protein COLO4_15026 [Corchorus olitorius]|uniref:Sey1/RHD3-like three-helix bundle domain-containing protein n=1 Tax=Corchorus olitorius TaxID=93759 RepID=A0A1R3JQ47_9ROSI|nr:hypothetical protein COLO4_15026 [Corchorus olitorius]